MPCDEPSNISVHITFSQKKMIRPSLRTLCPGHQSYRSIAATQKNEYDDATPAPADQMCRVLFLSMHLLIKRLQKSRHNPAKIPVSADL